MSHIFISNLIVCHILKVCHIYQYGTHINMSHILIVCHTYSYRTTDTDEVHERLYIYTYVHVYTHTPTRLYIHTSVDIQTHTSTPVFLVPRLRQWSGMSMSHVAHTNESYCTYRYLTSDKDEVWESLYSCIYLYRYIYIHIPTPVIFVPRFISGQICQWVMSHIWMRHVAHMNASCRIYECVMSHIWMSHVTRVSWTLSPRLLQWSGMGWLR